MKQLNKILNVKHMYMCYMFRTLNILTKHKTHVCEFYVNKNEAHTYAFHVKHNNFMDKGNKIHNYMFYMHY